MKFAAGLRKRILRIGEMPAANPEADRVLVLDGADAVGHRVVECLISAEYTNLRVGSRALHQGEGRRGVESVRFVWEDEATWANALKDVDAVFVTLPIKPTNWDLHFPKFCKACKVNQVTRIIKLSFYHSIKGNPKHFSDLGFYNVPFVRKHALCDGDLVVQKKLHATIIFASHLMSNVFCYEFERKALMDKQEFYGASRGKGVNYVSPNDIADMVVNAILQKTRKREAYLLLGPSTISDKQVATLLSEQLGTNITYVEKQLDFFDNNTASLEMIKAAGFGKNIIKSDTIRILGREAETFDDYLKATDRMSRIERKALSVGTGRVYLDGKHVTEEKEEEKKEESVGPAL